MKRLLIFVLLTFLFSGCAASDPGKTAVYLFEPGSPVLEEESVKKHRDIVTARDMADLKEHLEKPICIWIDKNATDTVPRDWFLQEPQSDYPVMVIGYNDPVYVFGTIYKVSVPFPEQEKIRSLIPSGYSLWKKTSSDKDKPEGHLKGYSTTDIEEIRKNSLRLLKGEPPL